MDFSILLLIIAYIAKNENTADTNADTLLRRSHVCIIIKKKNDIGSIVLELTIKLSKTGDLPQTL